MSYCVNCGVELEKDCKVCPLCHTLVINPSQRTAPAAPASYPRIPGSIAPAQREDVCILMTVILAATAISCGLLNFFFFQKTHWSLYVIGACILLWIFCSPVFFPSRILPWVSLLLDGIGIALYFGFVALLHPGRGWYVAIALPLTALGNALVQLFLFLSRHPRSSILSQAAVFFCEAAIVSVSIELLTRNYVHAPLTLSWSAIILTCCLIIDVALITILQRTRLREEVRRRMHF